MIGWDTLYEHALSFWGKPYIWGGDGTERYFGGYDCSGLVQAILDKAGMDPKGDQTAQALYNHFSGRPHYKGPSHGALAFFGTEHKVTHVGFCLDDKIMIHATGGGSHVTSTEKAKRVNASVQITPIKYRPDCVGILLPDYSGRVTFPYG